MDWNLSKDLRTIDCGHCGNNFRSRPQSYDRLGEDAKGIWLALSFECPSCLNFSLFHQCVIMDGGIESHVEQVYPRNSSKALPPEVPPPLAKDFKEAHAVLGDSPKASAALSRRILQTIFNHHLSIKKRSLDEEIEEFIKSRHPPSYISDCLHHLRELGNGAAHPWKDKASGEIIEVEAGEAEHTLAVVNSMFDFVFVQPAKAQKMRDDLNAKLVAAGKRPLDPIGR